MTATLLPQSRSTLTDAVQVESTPSLWRKGLAAVIVVPRIAAQLHD